MTKSYGIYAIRLRDSGKLYIGQTGVSFAARWRAHRSELRLGKHANKKLQHVWNKYGEGSFDFHVIQELDNSTDLGFWESFWIDKLKPELNLNTVGETMLGYKHSEDTKRKIREAKGRSSYKRTEAQIKSAADKNRGKIRSQEVRDKISAGNKGKPKSKEHVAKNAAAHARVYWFTNPDGEVVKIVNLNAYCRDNNLIQGSMSAIWQGRINSHRGWTKAEAAGCGYDADASSAARQEADALSVGSLLLVEKKACRTSQQ